MNAGLGKRMEEGGEGSRPFGQNSKVLNNKSPSFLPGFTLSCQTAIHTVYRNR